MAFTVQDSDSMTPSKAAFQQIAFFICFLKKKIFLRENKVGFVLNALVFFVSSFQNFVLWRNSASWTSLGQCFSLPQCPASTSGFLSDTSREGEKPLSLSAQLRLCGWNFFFPQPSRKVPRPLNCEILFLILGVTTSGTTLVFTSL